MFKALGILLIAYVAFAVYRGQVYAKAGPGGRMVRRAESTGYFWLVIGVYLSLALALILFF
jgi:hypothetical protein